MIREVTYYQAICDKCGVSAHEGGDFSAWADEESAVEEAEGCDWAAPGPASLAVDGPHYCPECVPTEAPACPHDSRSGAADGRWRCDQCGADCGPNTYLTQEADTDA